jgi:hypothetical protein
MARTMSKTQQDPIFEKQVKVLAGRITEEIFIALGWRRNGIASKIFAPLFRLPTRRFARIAARFENDVVDYDPRTAATNALPQFAMQATATGIENIPLEGPVLIVSNHPGALDSIALVSSIPRPDITALVSDIPFLNAMPGIRKHVIFVDFKTIGGMEALREAIAHLQRGGAILLFAHGEVEPDPGFMPGARKSIEEWSRSIEVMLRKVPETRLVITTVSDALLPRFIHHPFTLLRKAPAKRQKLGEVLQVIMQMLYPKKLLVRPRITFSKSLSVDDLETGMYMPEIIERAQKQMDRHLTRETHNS